MEANLTGRAKGKVKDWSKSVIADLAPGSVKYEHNPSHLHEVKAQPIKDGNRAERRAYKKLRKKKC